MVSRKLDGVRVISYLLNNEVIFYSRTGSVFNTLSTLSENVKNILKKAKQVYDCEFVLDGECCLIDECGKEDFSGIMKEITRKNHTIKKPIYTIFDLIPKDEFDSRKGTTIFKERMKKLEHLEIEKLGDYVKLIVHQNTINANDYEHWIKKSQEDK
jgi:ATP-dependent DNA ligase